MPGNGGAMAKLDKPASIEANPFKSQKWDEVTAGRTFSKSDIPTLVLLCHWYAVADKCMDDCEIDGEMQVAYMNDKGDINAMPQIGTLKQASSRDSRPEQAARHQRRGARRGQTEGNETLCNPGKPARKSRE